MPSTGRTKEERASEGLQENGIIGLTQEDPKNNGAENHSISRRHNFSRICLCLPALLLSFRYAYKCSLYSVSIALGLVTAWSCTSDNTSIVMRSSSVRRRQSSTSVLLNPTCICGGGKLIPHTNTLQTPEHVPSNSFRREFKSALICSRLAAHSPIISPRAPHLSPHAWLCHGVCSAQYDMGYPGCSPNTRLLPNFRLGRWERAEPAPRQRPGLPLVQRHSSQRVTRDVQREPIERDTS